MQKAIVCIDADRLALTQLNQLISQHFGNEYVIETAETPDEAIKVIELLMEYGIKTVVFMTSYLLPKINGIQLIKQVQLLDPQTKVILFADYVALEMMEQIINSTRLFRLLKKSCKKDELIQTTLDAVNTYYMDQKTDFIDTQMKKSEIEKNLLLKSITEGMIFIDANYDILWMNDVAINDFGNLNIYNKCYEKLYCRTKPCSDCEISNILLNAKQSSKEIKLDNGIYKQVKYYPVKDQSEKILGILMSLTDITVRKRHETLNTALLDIAKLVNNCDSAIYLYQNIYDTLSKDLSANYMCVAGRDFDNVFIEFVVGKDKLVSYKKVKNEEIEHIIDVMDIIAKQIQMDEKNNYIIKVNQDDIEIAMGINDKILIITFKNTLQSDILYKFIKSLVELLKTGLTKIESIKKITYQANHDSLTGLHNREFFSKAVNSKIYSQREIGSNPKKFALAVLDLNYFKDVNDTYGHVIGDEVLFSVSQKILKALRHVDLVARIGGDEFAILIEYLSKNEVIKVVERIQSSIANPIAVGKSSIQLGSSIGLIHDICKYTHSEKALTDADLAMYEAKKYKEGAGCYRFFEKEIQDKIQQHAMIGNYLKNATHNKELYMLYQPIISLKTFKVVGFEAFIRWEKQDGTFYNPKEFIQVAEDVGSIENIGNYVFDEVNDAISIISKDNFEDLCFISINFTEKQLLSEQQIHKLESLGYSRNLLQVEVTEKSLVGHFDKASKSIEKLKNMGIKIRLDDFGTGDSPLSHLNTMRISDIKVDHTFVQQLPDNEACKKWVKVIYTVAKSLDMSLTAEGVENEEQLKYLVELGCDFAQGYHISFPLTLPDAINFKKNNPFLEKYRHILK